jgi:hypothetical protein
LIWLKDFFPVEYPAPMLHGLGFDGRNIVYVPQTLAYITGTASRVWVFAAARGAELLFYALFQLVSINLPHDLSPSLFFSFALEVLSKETTLTFRTQGIYT